MFLQKLIKKLIIIVNKKVNKTDHIERVVRKSVKKKKEDFFTC